MGLAQRTMPAVPGVSATDSVFHPLDVTAPKSIAALKDFLEPTDDSTCCSTTPASLQRVTSPASTSTSRRSARLWKQTRLPPCVSLKHLHRYFDAASPRGS